MLTAGLFIAGLVLFIGGVSAIRANPDQTNPPDQLFRRQGYRHDGPMEYVQVDGAVLGTVGLFVMLATALL